MSLITNEIHILDGFKKTILVFGADRRISKPDGSFDSIKPKLFRIPYLRGGVSYFGLAEVFPKGKRRYLADWLPAFITSHAGTKTLKEFSFKLRDELSGVVPPTTLKDNPSGFHIAGYNVAGIPEFWFVRNIGGMDKHRYIDLQPKYGDPTADFLERDARSLGWDGADPMSVENKVQCYRNGDIRAHVCSWERLDKMFAEMNGFPDMRKLRTSDDLAKWVKFKFKFVAEFYKQFAHRQIISTPIDVFCTSNGLD
jgi:hypothetical protein